MGEHRSTPSWPTEQERDVEPVHSSIDKVAQPPPQEYHNLDDAKPFYPAETGTSILEWPSYRQPSKNAHSLSDDRTPTQYSLQAPGDHDPGPFLKYYRDRLHMTGYNEEQILEATRDTGSFWKFLETERTRHDSLDSRNSGEGQAASGSGGDMLC